MEQTALSVTSFGFRGQLCPLWYLVILALRPPPSTGGSSFQSGPKPCKDLMLPSFLFHHWNILCSCLRAWLLPGEQVSIEPVRPSSADPDIPDLLVESQTSSPSLYTHINSSSCWTEPVLIFIPSHLPGMPSLILHSFNRYLMSIHYVTGNVLSAENRRNKQIHFPSGRWSPHWSLLPWNPDSSIKFLLLSNFSSFLYHLLSGINKIFINQVMPCWPTEHQRFLIQGFMNLQTVCTIWCLCEQPWTENPQFSYNPLKSKKIAFISELKLFIWWRYLHFQKWISPTFYYVYWA